MPIDEQVGVRARLSTREREILQLIALGLTDRQIAERLVLARSTVKWHNRQIYTKLGVERRNEAVARAMAHGLLSDRPVQSKRLPPSPSPFIGRTRELDLLKELFAESTARLITIVALGGMGKSRLALAAAEASRANFPDGVFFVALVGAASQDEIIESLAGALGVTFLSDGRSPYQQLLDNLRAKRLLLVLDNFEQLLDETSLILDLLQTAHQLRLIVTSREPLNLRNEHILWLEGLSCPTQVVQDILAYDAVQLFIQAARQAHPHFVADDIASIVRICHLVQGMPLALELAGAWTHVLSAAEIAAAIEQTADVLRSSKRDMPERLRSVRAVFAWTWSRLTDGEQAVFRRLAVFNGGFSRASAECVAGATIDTLSALIHYGLLSRHPGGSRFELHELLRQYAWEQLEAAGEAERLQDAHCAYFSQCAYEWSQALKTPQHLSALDSLDYDNGNIRHAFKHAIRQGTSDALEPFAGLYYYYEIRGQWLVGLELLDAAIARLMPVESGVLGKLLIGQAVCLDRLDRYEESENVAQRSLLILRRFEAWDELPVALIFVGSAQRDFAGMREEPKALFHEGIRLTIRTGDLWSRACLYYQLGQSAVVEGQLETGNAYFLQGYGLMKQLHNLWGVTWMLDRLASIALDRADYASAAHLYRESLATAQQMRHPITLESALMGLSVLAWIECDFDTAKELAEKIIALRRATGREKRVVDFMIWLAEIALSAGEPLLARQHLAEAGMLLGEVEHWPILFYCVVAADFRMQYGAPETAVELLGFVDQHLQFDGMPVFTRPKLTQLRVQASSELTEHTFECAYKRGAVLGFDAMRRRLPLAVLGLES